MGRCRDISGEVGDDGLLRAAGPPDGEARTSSVHVLLSRVRLRDFTSRQASQDIPGMGGDTTGLHEAELMEIEKEEDEAKKGLHQHDDAAGAWEPLPRSARDPHKSYLQTGTNNSRS